MSVLDVILCVSSVNMIQDVIICCVFRSREWKRQKWTCQSDNFYNGRSAVLL